GTTFQLFTKANRTDPWTLRDTVVRSDIPAGSPMQLGLWFGTFTSNLGSIQFDHFSLSGAGLTGTATSDAPNTIADNQGSGVAALDSWAPANAIRATSIRNNGRLGIDLGDNGVTLNDSAGHDGPNNYQSFPVLTSAVTTSTQTTITGTFNSGSRNSAPL